MRFFQDYDSIEELTDAAEEIPEVVWEESFPTDLLRTLNEYSKRYDKLDHSRYGWLVEADIEVLNAAALPIGDVRDPIEVRYQGFDRIINLPDPPARTTAMADLWAPYSLYFIRLN